MSAALSEFTIDAANIFTSYRGSVIFCLNLINLNAAVTCESAVIYGQIILLLSSAYIASDDMANRGQLLVC